MKHWHKIHLLVLHTNPGGITGSDVEGQAEKKTIEQFKSGEVAYLLQGEQETHVWGQTIGLDKIPTLGGEKVYQLTDCQNQTVYTNGDYGIVHGYDAPEFQWAEDHTTCTAVFTCACGASETLPCELSVEISEDGTATIYTATVTCQGKTYTDVQEIENEIISMNIFWGDLSFAYTIGQGWDNPENAWVQVENTGDETISVTYTFETERNDITGSFHDGETGIESPVAIDVENTKKIWLHLDGEPSQVLNGTRIGTVKLTIE